MWRSSIGKKTAGIYEEVLRIDKKIAGICGEVLSIGKRIAGICGDVLSTVTKIALDMLLRMHSWRRRVSFTFHSPQINLHSISYSVYTACKQFLFMNELFPVKMCHLCLKSI
jgi:hypothetical protein